MLLGTLAANVLENALTGRGVIRAGGDTIRVGKILNAPHPLTNFEIQKYYQHEPKFNRVYSRNYLLK